MEFQEPKVEFINLNLEESIITTSPAGPGYDVCEKEGPSGMDQPSFCTEMGVAGMPLDD